MTQKIIQTTENQLSGARDIIKQQEDELRKTKLALRQLERATQCKKKAGANKHTPPSQNHPLGMEPQQSRPEERLPSFARPTRASQRRESTPSTSFGASTPSKGVPSSRVISENAKHTQRVTIQGKPHIYTNGKLAPASPGYLLSTQAAISKFGDNERRREEGCGVCHPSFEKEVDIWGCYPTTEPVTAVSGQVVQPKQPEQSVEIMSREEFEDIIQRKQIEIRTRLFDDAWISNPANNVCINDDEVFDILWRGERLAKRCLWRWLRINRPDKCRRSRLQYLSDLDFGRDNLSRLFDCRIFYYRHTETYEVESVLEQLIWLRNKVHHFTGCSFTLASIDEHLSDVQRLAVLLYDEESASSARGLRDRLRREVQEVAQDIETTALLMALPFAEDHPWKPEHIKLFRQILVNYQGDEEYARVFYSAAALEGAMEFAKRIRGSDMSWDCEPDMEASLMKSQRLENGGGGHQCGSASRKGRVSSQFSPNRWRSSSTNGPRTLPLCSRPASVQATTRRASFSLDADDRLMA